MAHSRLLRIRCAKSEKLVNWQVLGTYWCYVDQMVSILGGMKLRPSMGMRVD